MPTGVPATAMHRRMVGCTLPLPLSVSVPHWDCTATTCRSCIYRGTTRAGGTLISSGRRVVLQVALALSLRYSSPTPYAHWCPLGGGGAERLPWTTDHQLCHPLLLLGVCLPPLLLSVRVLWEPFPSAQLPGVSPMGPLFLSALEKLPRLGTTCCWGLGRSLFCQPWPGEL